MPRNAGKIGVSNVKARKNEPNRDKKTQLVKAGRKRKLKANDLGYGSDNQTAFETFFEKLQTYTLYDLLAKLKNNSSIASKLLSEFS